MHGNHPLYGELRTTVREILEKFAEKGQIDIKDGHGRRTGSITFNKFTVIQKPSFVDYLRSGWYINMSVAIDFTASNGEPIEPQSLHRIDPSGMRPNQYESAIQSVGSILEPYAY